MKKFALTAIALAMFSGSAMAAIVKMPDGFKAVNAGQGIVEIQKLGEDGKWSTYEYHAMEEQTSFRNQNDMVTVNAVAPEHLEEAKKGTQEWNDSKDLGGKLPEFNSPSASTPGLPGDEGLVENPGKLPAFGLGDKIVANVGQNKDNIAAMGEAFEQRVDVVNGYLSQAGQAIQNNADRINGLQGAFEAQAAHTSKEIARLDGRIDALEANQNKLKAGIAGATAIATLSQHVGAGNHNIAVAVGGYDGESAVAAGYTYIFDDRRTSFRATISTDSESEVAMGASIGHSW